MPPPISWCVMTREALASVLLRSDEPRPNRRSFPNEEVEGGAIAVGIRGSQREPALVVVRDEEFAVTLSWLRAFASEAFPVTQFARIVSLADWRVLALEDEQVVRESSAGLWGSILVAEALAQSEPSIELGALNGARLSACFSAAPARVGYLFANPRVADECLRRLQFLQRSMRLGRRSLSVEDIAPVWTLARELSNESWTIQGAAEALLVTGRRLAGRTSEQLEMGVTERILEPFRSDSIEERTVAFQRVQMEADAMRSPLASAIALAVSAFLVGRGTSHQFLLRRNTRRPAALVWFGLLAGLAGPVSWDRAWFRAVLGAERIIRGRFELFDPPITDLSWHEYSWIVSVFGATRDAALAELPRQQSKSLSIELMPGAPVHIRIEQDTERLRPDADAARRQLLFETLQALTGLASRALQLADGERAPERPAQQTREPAKRGRGRKPEE
jgi:hypothetical protein